MAKGLLSLSSLGLLSVAWAVAPQSAAAWGDGPLKVDAGINVRVNITTVPNIVPSAPWYTYFPYDPNLMAPPPGTPYPTWPRPFPPKTAPTGANMPSPNNNMPLAPRSSPIASAPGQTLQPVGYAYAPSYWYSR